MNMNRLEFFKNIGIGESITIDNAIIFFDHIVAAYEYLSDAVVIDINSINCNNTDSTIIFNINKSNLSINPTNCCKYVYGKTFNISSIESDSSNFSIIVK